MLVYHPCEESEAHHEIVAVLGAGKQACVHAQVMAHCYKGAKVRILLEIKRSYKTMSV